MRSKENVKHNNDWYFFINSFSFRLNKIDRILLKLKKAKKAENEKIQKELLSNIFNLRGDLCFQDNINKKRFVDLFSFSAIISKKSNYNFNLRDDSVFEFAFAFLISGFDETLLKKFINEKDFYNIELLKKIKNNEKLNKEEYKIFFLKMYRNIRALNKGTFGVSPLHYKINELFCDYIVLNQNEENFKEVFEEEIQKNYRRNELFMFEPETMGLFFNVIKLNKDNTYKKLASEYSLMCLKKALSFLDEDEFVYCNQQEYINHCGKTIKDLLPITKK
jgi:translation elongation factor EF-G